MRCTRQHCDLWWQHEWVSLGYLVSSKSGFNPLNRTAKFNPLCMVNPAVWFVSSDRFINCCICLQIKQRNISTWPESFYWWDFWWRKRGKGRNIYTSTSWFDPVILSHTPAVFSWWLTLAWPFNLTTVHWPATRWPSKVIPMNIHHVDLACEQTYLSWFGLLWLSASATGRDISRRWNDDEMSVSLVKETRVPGGN